LAEKHRDIPKRRVEMKTMTIFFLAAFLFVPVIAGAQDTGVGAIDILKAGIYKADETSQLKANESSLDTVSKLKGIELVKETDTIPAKLGMRFGFWYLVRGTPLGSMTTITQVIIFPPKGLKQPGKERVYQNKIDFQAKIGGFGYIDYSFDYEWEVIPGKWIVQLWCTGKKLAEKTFNIE